MFEIGGMWPTHNPPRTALMYQTFLSVRSIAKSFPVRDAGGGSGVSQTTRLNAKLFWNA